MVSVADAMTDLMVGAGVAPREKFTSVYSGMDVEPFLASPDHREAARRELGYGPDEVVVGKIARLARLKGHDSLIAAAGDVVRARPEVRFLLVGDGPLREELQRQIGAAGLSGCFRLLGLVPPERIPRLLAAMDVVVHTSLREGLARVLPQALIAGRPVVSFDVDGAREVGLPEVTGCVVPPLGSEPVAEAIVRLAADPALRERLGSEGRRRFTDQFRHERMAAQLRGLYERLLGRSS